MTPPGHSEQSEGTAQRSARENVHGSFRQSVHSD